MDIRKIGHYTFNPELKARRLGDVMMVYNPDTAETLELNDTGMEIFGYLSQQMPIAEMMSRLAEEYGVEEAEIAGDVAEFIERMILQGVIELGED